MGVNTKIIEEWWEILTLIGAGFFLCALFFDTQYVNLKHVAGLGIGLITLGVSCWISARNEYSKTYGGYFVTKKVRFTTFTMILFITGVVISLLFLLLLVYGLI